jgi:hypothetical protein
MVTRISYRFLSFILGFNFTYLPIYNDFDSNGIFKILYKFINL